AVVLIYPLIGMVVRLGVQARQRRVEKAKLPPTTGRDHADLGQALSAGGGLVGVVGSVGRPASAIFQMGGSSTSVSVGEAIGSSGWRLRSADGDTAMIERGGEVRRISISNGY
ncbi:DUF4079 domain-containing protein, partial [Synechococcus sp. BA-120 BA3]|nr:DUF4079 domain-containing protein [Synechococcus sp. BA-120 BA3]